MNIAPERKVALRAHGGAFRTVAVQLLLGSLLAIALPAVFALAAYPDQGMHPSAVNSLAGGLFGVMIGNYVYRRFDNFPGVRRFASVLPSFFTSYGLVLLVMFLARVPYSRAILAISFIGAVCAFFLVSRYSKRATALKFYVVPFGEFEWMGDRGNLDFEILEQPMFPDTEGAVLVADLRSEIPDDWERMIAEVAIGGNPVYHTKQLRESLEGRVQIEHLSENSFGSLIPNLNYHSLKRAIDIAASLLAIPALLVVCPLIALGIAVSSRGPILFRQRRMGFRGQTFDMVKFRTMRVAALSNDDERRRRDAVTLTADARIFPFGRFLRRTRLDELPQFWNVLRGEMSLIGPRPEALDLAAWYDERLPFYAYRHIVRPGITGWAQVNQGHVAALEDVQNKLHYDFYYIKNFSAWLDFLIALRTTSIMLTGFGSK